MRVRQTHDTLFSKLSLRENEKRFRSLIDKSPDVIALFGETGNLLYVSPAVKKVLGYSSKELIGLKNPLSLVKASDFLKIKKTFGEVKKNPQMSADILLEVICKDGSIKWIEAKIINYLEDKDIKSVLVNFRDVSHKKRTEDRQKFLNLLNKALITNIDNSINLKELGKLLVPRVCDYCKIAVLSDDNFVDEITVINKDPENAKVIKKFYGNFTNKENSIGIGKILKIGKPEYIAKVNKSKQKKQRIQSYMGVPLLIRKRVVGAITFSSLKKNYLFTKNDFTFAKEIARQVAYTFENSSLHKKAQKAIESRDEFISMASHELKTPITTVKVFTQLLEKRFQEKNDTQSLKVLQKLDNNIEKLTALIKDLLDMSRIQRGKLLDLHLEKFLVKELVMDIVEDLQPISSHVLTLDWPTKLYVYADKDRIRQVLVNFITNAIKYSPDSQKIILSSRKNGNFLKIFIQDFGIGIEKDEQKKIFNRFYQANSNSTFPGLGLGLYISSEIIKRHEGKVGVKSEKGKGSTFYFTLPIYSAKKS